MTKQTKYGVISDVHSNPRIVPLAIDALKNHGAEKLLINGDIGNQQKTLQDSQNYIAFILDSLGKSGLESFVQPGSHETLLAFGPVMEHFAEQYSNLIDVTKNQKIEQDGHHLVFLPGSDFLCGGEYQIGNNQTPSGKYFKNIHNELLPSSINKEELQRLADIGKLTGKVHYFNIVDLKKLITNPDKTIMICHVPRKFDNLETTIDMAEFGEVKEDFELQGEIKEKGSIYPIQIAQQIFQAGYPIELKKENRGNKDLKELYEEIGINKAVSGHFHESGHRANDRNGNHIQEGVNVNELFWNSGYLDASQTGILTVEGEKVNYQNISLQDYL